MAAATQEGNTNLQQGATHQKASAANKSLLYRNEYYRILNINFLHTRSLRTSAQKNIKLARRVSADLLEAIH